MKTLHKPGSHYFIVMRKDNGFIAFDTTKNSTKKVVNTEYILHKELVSFLGFLKRSGYKFQN